MNNNKSNSDEQTGEDRIIYRVARMTRMLRNSMRELELDTKVVKASECIFDAKERLNYVVTMTEQAAQKTLNSVEDIRPLQEGIQNEAKALKASLEACDDTLIKNQGIEALDKIDKHASITQKQMMEIIMAQDYQDLTGQVLKRLMDIVQEMQNEFVNILMENIEESRTKEIKESFVQSKANDDYDSSYLNGPAMSAKEGSDAVASQDDVDSLLDAFDL